MADYLYIENYSKLGKMGISRRVFETIAQKATNTVEGAYVSKNSRNASIFSVKHAISCVFRKNGKVDIKVPVSIKKGYDVTEISTKIQQEIANAMMSMCEVVPFNITVTVVSIES